MQVNVLNNIVIDHPCNDSQQPLLRQRSQLPPYDRQAEEQKMGNFNLEEGVRNMMLSLGDNCDFNLDETEEFNMNIEQVIRSNNINRGQNNIITKAVQQQQQPVGQQPQAMQQP